MDRYTISFESWAEALAEWKRLGDAAYARQSEEKKEQQRRAELGITVTPNPPARRNAWNDEPPADA